MPNVRIALGNLRAPSTREESVEIAVDAMKTAAKQEAAVICFPECFVPGYRVEASGPKPDQDWLNRAWETIDAKAGELGIGVILGTERVDSSGLMITARVTNADGTLAGFQDKVQLDPSEEGIYVAGSNRQIFQCGELTFGVVICHEGWRYPETVRSAARQSAHVVFHPHFEIVGNPDYRPKQFADPANTFHEKAALCRAAENSIYFATVNCALKGSTTTSAIIDPEGVLVTHQPYGEAGVLVGVVDTEQASGFLAKRLKSR